MLIRKVAVGLTCVTLAACGGDDGGSSGADAAPSADARPIAREDHPLVIKAVRLPTTMEEVEQSSLEWPGSNGPVNRIGGLTSVLLQITTCLDLSTTVNDAIAAGETLNLYVLRSAPLGQDDPAATVYWAMAEDADGDPANTLTGTGQVRLAPGQELALGATIEIDGFMGEGHGSVDTPVNWLLKMLADEDPVPTPGVYARWRGELNADGTFTGLIGSAVTKQQFQAEVYPGIAKVLTAAIAGATETECNQVKGIYDTNQDDVVSVQELIENDNMDQLLTPDVDLDGDGTKDHISQVAFAELVPVELVE